MSTQTTKMNAHEITQKTNDMTGYPTDEEVQYCIDFYDDLFNNLVEAGPDFACVRLHVIATRQTFESMKYFRNMH